MLVAETRQDFLFSSLTGFNRLALAVSGGSDSLAMLRMVHEWAARDVQIFALTVDHGLREDSAHEAASVAAWCAGLGIAHKILRWHHEGIASGVQAKARKARYDLMADWCLAHDVPVLLTAHTADDQAETVAMRLARTSTAASLSGIWPERDWDGIRLIRPLLNARRHDLRIYLHGLGQDWIDDPSNENPLFERVRIRHMLDGDLQGLDRRAAQAQFTVTKISIAAKTWASAYFQIHETGFLTVERSEMSKLSDDMLDLVLQRMLKVCAPAAKKTELEERTGLVKWLRNPQFSRRSLGGAIFVKRKDVVVVGREPGRISREPVLVPQSGVVIWDQRFEVRAPAGCQVVPLANLDQMPRRKDIPAFVQSGLPAVRNISEEPQVPHLNIGSGVGVKFLRH